MKRILIATSQKEQKNPLCNITTTIKAKSQQEEIELSRKMPILLYMLSKLNNKTLAISFFIMVFFLAQDPTSRLLAGAAIVYLQKKQRN